MTTARFGSAFAQRLVALGCVGVVLWTLAPIAWISLASLQTERDIIQVPPYWVPRAMTLDNYGYIFTGRIPQAMVSAGASSGSRISQEARRLLRAVGNSFIVATLVGAGNLLVAVPASYALSRFHFRGSSWYETLIILSRLIPIPAIAIPYYLMVSKANLVDTHLALVLIHLALTLPIVTWFLAGYFRDFPRSLEEAAALDGCSTLRIMTRILVPLAVPGLMASAALAFMTSYSEFFFALLVTQTIRAQTAPVILAAIGNNQDVSLALIAVSTVIAIAPIAVITLAFRHYIVRGYTIGVEK